MLAKVAIAIGTLVVGLAGVTYSAIHATHGATIGARQIKAEFRERLDTDAALLAATENANLAVQRLRNRDPREAAELERRLAASDSQLALSIGTALAGNGAHGAEVGPVRAIHAAYPAYVGKRAALLALPSRGAADSRADDRLKDSFVPLQRAISSYGDVHFADAGGYLKKLEGSRGNRTLLLVVSIAISGAALLALLIFARGIVVRVRDYSGFAGEVAGGDLGAQLDPRGRDELTALGHSLNTMVDQLSSVAESRRRQHITDGAYRASQDTFSEGLRVTESEREAHDLLKLHIERSIPGSDALVLNRNNSEDRLEPATALPEGSPLAESLQTAQPRACLAVRLARTFESGGQAGQLLSCEICGTTPQASTCVPLLVSGEVIGSVLVNHPKALEDSEPRRLHESVAQAAPTLANLRNLALAEARAATDALTGLPNRRAIQDTLKRLIAQSSRTVSPMAAILVDLDHFKQVNDTYGHEQGDAVLAAVGDILAESVRASDFVGRNGGEEFIALLPDTPADMAVTVAEKLCSAVARVSVARVDRPITASFGIAVFPDHAGDAETLLRLADRALYAAKAAGRNQVHITPGPPADTHPAQARRPRGRTSPPTSPPTARIGAN